MQISTERAARLGAEAHEINQAGQYIAPSGRTVSIAKKIEQAGEGTLYISPEEEIGPPSPGSVDTSVEIQNEETLVAAHSLVVDGHDPVILNFASGMVPGGGYRVGSRAQEESIARSSALVPALERAPEFYELHRQLGDQHHTDAMIYSPAVPVFRDGIDLLERPWEVAVISAAAPRVPGPNDAAVTEAFRRRIPRILRLGLREGHDAIVLGAWGCGAFGNAPEVVAGIFRAAVDEIRGTYEVIVFAIIDSRENGGNLAAFRSAFA